MARVGVDLDGVLANFNRSYAKLLMRLEPYRVFPIDDPNWPKCWHWDVDAGVSQNTIQTAWTDIKESSIFWKFLYALPNAKSDLLRLQQIDDMGHDIYFITNRPGIAAKKQTEEWLHWQGFENPTVLVTVEHTKDLVSVALGLDAYIDDKPENLIGHARDTRLFLIDMPYNQQAVLLNRLYTRVKTVSDALKLLKLED